MPNLKTFENAVRKAALAYPETREDHPHGYTSAFKSGGKGFVGMMYQGEELLISLKLPQSHVTALKLPCTEPTHGGLGKHGWVSVRLGPSDEFSLKLILSWIDESFLTLTTKATKAKSSPKKTRTKSKPKKKRND